MAGKRKKVKIDEEQIKTLCEFGLDLNELASVSGVSVSTLKRHYDQIIKEGRDKLHYSLKRKQIEIAMGGSVPMLIWLGKQLLGQADKIENSDTTDYSDLMAKVSTLMK